MPEISLKEMLEAGVHFGHQTRRWNPKMRRFIFGERNGVYLINLDQSLQLVAEACMFLAKTVANGGNILFVGTKRQAQTIVEEEARRCKMFSVTQRWLGGTLTNFKTIRGGIERLKKIETMFQDGTAEKLVKKERMKMAKEKVKLERNLLGIKEMGRLPAAMFIIDPKREDIAVAEARRLNIPIVAIVDTNCNPDLIDHIIPGNDDATRSIALLTRWIADSCLEGLSRRDEKILAEMDKESGSDEPGPEEKTTEGVVVTRRKPRRKVEEVDDHALASDVADTASFNGL